MKTLTEWQWASLLNRYNFADGHARQRPFEFERPLIDGLSDMYWEVKATEQKNIERDFLNSYFELAQIQQRFESRYVVHYSSSLSIEVAANLCRRENWTVGILHPTFDNIPDIFRRHDIKIVAVDEHLVEASDWSILDEMDCFLMVLPNNPTGLSMSENEFLSLARAAKDKDVILILDFSFRFFCPSFYDQYGILDEIGCSYVAIEDTGKTLGHHDMKIGFSVASPDLIDAIRLITDDILLNVSPFTILFLGKCFDLYRKKNGLQELKSLVATNYETLEQCISNTPLVLESHGRHLSCAWLRSDIPVSTSKLVNALLEDGIGVLPGQPFYWSDPEKGRNHVRIALLRDAQNFREGMTRMFNRLKTFY